MASLLTRLRDFLSHYRHIESVNNKGEIKATDGTDTLWSLSFWRAVAGEFIALVLFIPIATGSSVLWSDRNEPNNTQIALANGLMIATLMQCFSHVSGAHFNPAVTLSFAWTRDVSILRAAFYILAQCAGSSVGGLYLREVTPSNLSHSVGCTLLGDGVSLWQGFLVEFIISFQLVFTIFATMDPSRRDVKGSNNVAVGFSVVCGNLYAIAPTGASMNPARSFGPALATGTWQDHWIYWAAPITAGLLASNIFTYIFANDASKLKLLERCSSQRRPLMPKLEGKESNRLSDYSTI